MGNVQKFENEVWHGPRFMTAKTDDDTLWFGRSTMTGSKRLDLKFGGSTSAKFVFLDSSANTFTFTGIAQSLDSGLILTAITAPTAATGATGTAQTAEITATGGVGGGTTIATTGTGGIGGGYSWTAGAGGVASAAATAATGGAGGAWAVTTGAGGAEAIATVTSTGGAGGAISGTSGAGGAVSGAVSGTATGGASGAVALASGVGGAVTATTGTNVGGASGAASLVSGTGGAATGATDTGGASGNVSVSSGTGGLGDTGGASGSLTLSTGTGGAGSGTGGATGNVTIQTGAPGSGGSPTAGSILFSPAATEAMRLTLLNVFIGDSSNVGTTQGLTINQGVNDDAILELKSSDVAHGVTNVTETDTYGSFQKAVAANGGLLMTGLDDTASIGVRIRGIAATADGTYSTAGVGAVIIDGQLKSGTGVASLGADKSILVVRDNVTARFMLDSDGDSHQDVGTAWTNFDDYDDAKLLTALSVGVSKEGDPVREAFSATLDEYRPQLAAANLVQFNDDGHHFVNMSRLTMVLTGAVRQLSDKLGEAMARLGAAEQKLLAAGA